MAAEQVRKRGGTFEADSLGNLGDAYLLSRPEKTSRVGDSEPGQVLMRRCSEGAPESTMKVVGRKEGCARDFGQTDVFEGAGVKEVASPADTPEEFIAGGRLPAWQAADSRSHLGVQKQQVLSQRDELLIHPEAVGSRARDDLAEPVENAFVTRMDMGKKIGVDAIAGVQVVSCQGPVNGFYESCREKNTTGVDRLAGVDVERIRLAVAEHQERILAHDQAPTVVAPDRLPFDHRLDRQRAGVIFYAVSAGAGAQNQVLAAKGGWATARIGADELAGHAVGASLPDFVKKARIDRTTGEGCSYSE